MKTLLLGTMLALAQPTQEIYRYDDIKPITCHLCENLNFAPVHINMTFAHAHISIARRFIDDYGNLIDTIPQGVKDTFTSKDKLESLFNKHISTLKREYSNSYINIENEYENIQVTFYHNGTLTSNYSLFHYGISDD